METPSYAMDLMQRRSGRRWRDRKISPASLTQSGKTLDRASGGDALCHLTMYEQAIRESLVDRPATYELASSPESAGRIGGRRTALVAATAPPTPLPLRSGATVVQRISKAGAAPGAVDLYEPTHFKDVLVPTGWMAPDSNGQHSRTNYFRSRRLGVEVLSPSNARLDRTKKLALRRERLPRVLIDPSRARLESCAEGGRWTFRHARRLRCRARRTITEMS